MASYWLLCLYVCLFSYNIAQTFQEEIEYDCVDIYKQPGFQHPLMKNHKIQMRPSLEFQAMLTTEYPDTLDLSKSHKSKERCPKGQVPIHRTQTTNHTNHIIQPNHVITEENLHYAIIKPYENATVKLGGGGAQAVFNIYQPKVLKNQFSKSWIWLTHRNKSDISSIQFGWAVHRGLYRDNLVRLTTYFISKRHQYGCYNALCRGGFVQVHKTVYPGMVYDKVSTKGGYTYNVHLLVGQDSRTKNWLLITQKTLIGYWPYQIYSGEEPWKTYFGGYAGGPPGAPSPPMGAGNFPHDEGFSQNSECLMTQLKYFEDKRLVDVASSYYEAYTDSRKCYEAWFRMFEVGRGELLAFGGPGGECGM
ncbi:unnamed protein product [Cochlearia groenlandica]